MRKFGPRFRAGVVTARKHSRVLLQSFIKLASAVTNVGGTWSFEWPTSATGWKLPELVNFCGLERVWVAHFHGCRLGLLSVETGNPIKKPWTVMTTNQELRDDLDKQRCQCTATHSRCQGRDTCRSETYTPAIAKLVIRSLTRSPSRDASIPKSASLPRALSGIQLDPSSEEAVDLSYASQDDLVDGSGHRPLQQTPKKYLGLVTKVILARSPEFHSRRGKKAIEDEVNDFAS